MIIIMIIVMILIVKAVLFEHTTILLCKKILREPIVSLAARFLLCKNILREEIFDVFLFAAAERMGEGPGGAVERNRIVMKHWE